MDGSIRSEIIEIFIREEEQKIADSQEKGK
jgi:hypothetical protein